MKILLIIAAIVFFNFQLSKAYADTSCQPIYGGGQSCITTNNISIDKTILNPKTNKMVDNLGINDPKYQPEFIVTFQIKVTNTGNSDFSKVEVKDIFPQHISLASGPGNFDGKTNTLTFSLNNLKANESRTFIIIGKVAEEKSIPLDNRYVCVVNQALLTTNTNENAQDNTQFCIEKKQGFPTVVTFPIDKTPATGPGDFLLIGLAATGIIGYFLRRKSRILK